MLTSYLHLGRSFGGLTLNKTYISNRSASRLSSIKRGIQGETSSGSRDFSPRSFNRENGLSSGSARSSPARSFPRNDQSDKLQKFSARRDDRDLDQPRRPSFAKPSGGSDDKPGRFSARLERRSAERASASGSFGSNGGRDRNFSAGSAGRSSGMGRDEPRHSFDKPERRSPRTSDDGESRSVSERPSGRFGNKPGAFSDRPLRRSDDRPASFSDSPYSESSFPARPARRNDDGPRDYSDRPARRNDGPRPFSDRPTRRNDDRPRAFSDKPARSSDDGPRTFSDRAPRKADDSYQDRKPRDRDTPEDRSRASDFTPAKPENTYAKHEYISVPYTTAASEFLYGLNVVFAALKSRKRKIYTLYIHKRATNNVSFKGAELDRLAIRAGVKVRHVDNGFLPVMDKMTDNRPHNGVILEVSPLPTPVVEQLGKVEPGLKTTPLQILPAQSAEERALQGTWQHLEMPAEPWRQPFVLLLDGILDPGNLGNILRTAYFYGVDAVAVCVNTCAPLTSPVLHKAASGATEGLNILAVQKPADFVFGSSRNGWRVHAAVAPEAGKQTSRPQFSTNQMVSPLARAPSILMMGAEGEGLRLNLRTKASHNVIIAGQHRRVSDATGVDSLNVSAATAVLIEAFMRPPVESREKRESRLNAADEEKKTTEESEVKTVTEGGESGGKAEKLF